MDLITGAVGSLISKLEELLREEYNLLKGVPAKIKSLKEEIECAHAALRTVAGVPPDLLNDQVRIWAREVREVSYDMEDVLDTFLVSAKGDPKHTDHESLFEHLKKSMADTYNMVVSGQLIKSRKISLTIDDINKKLKEVTERYGRYTVNSIAVAELAANDPRLAVMYNDVTQLVGIEKLSAELISMISLSHEGDDESKMKLKMVSVVGTGGLGKTTLAKAVYDKLKVDFQCKAFVPVGQNPDLKKVFRDILIDLDKEFMDPKFTMLDERHLINEIRKFLNDKRYFVVIDDMWETKSWETIKLALVKNNTGSRIITTTRKLDVAQHANEFYELQPLPYEKSRKLFYTRIFGHEGRCHDNQLDEVSNKVLKKCGGVPLAIITMASLLVGKSREGWIDVCRSIVFRDKDKTQVSDTEWILSLSYYDLPAHLKTCLLYLSAFPEDYVINKSSLIWKWVVEGFVRDEPGASLFEVGEGYFNDLVNRSMIQAVESEEMGIVDGCHIHDMVLDLLRVKSQEENFVTISSSNAEGTSSTSRVRRLAHQNRMVGHTRQDTQVDLGHIRSFVACSCAVDNKGLSFRSFQLLRVVALEGCSSTSRNFIYLTYLQNLLHLRYLGLRKMRVHVVPEGIGALKFLQTLDLMDSNVAKSQLPSSVGLLTRLICLHAGFATVPNGIIEKLTSLEELQIRVPFDMTGQFVKDLGNLRELRVLEAYVLEPEASTQSDLVESLGNLHKLRHLTLDGLMSTLADKAIWDKAVLSRPLRHLIVRAFNYPVLPSCINPSDHPNLTRLELCVCGMDEQSLRILGRLPELRYLWLKTRSMVTVTIHGAEDGGFQKLISLLVPWSTVHFVLNEDSTISFTIWNSDRGDVAFVLNEDSTVSDNIPPQADKIGRLGPSSFLRPRSKQALVPPAVMPNLQQLEFQVGARTFNSDYLGLEYLPLLQKVKVDFQCALYDEVEMEEAALRHAIGAHPNRPKLQVDFSFWRNKRF